jgi:hypothetical protein
MYAVRSLLASIAKTSTTQALTTNRPRCNYLDVISVNSWGQDGGLSNADRLANGVWTAGPRNSAELVEDS